MLKVVEAFAGVGSQRMALRNLGIEHKVVGIFEIDKFALKSYEAIHGDCPNLGDISKIKGEEVPDHDLFTYSFPCQDLSVAGKQKGLGEGTRSGLLYQCKKVIEAKKPKYLLLENVKNLVGKKFKKDFDKWLEYLEGLGYKNYYEVLNAKDYGVPQNRERVFVVSILNDNKGYKFPKPIKLDKVIKDILEDNVDEKYYMDKPFKLVSKSHIAELDIAANEQVKRVCSSNKCSPCLNTMQGGHRESKILVERILQQVEVRKHKLDIDKLKNELKKCKKSSKLSNEEISLALGVNKTTVDHWFRNDKSFSIPSRSIWMRLKEVLKINTCEFDKGIMDFELKINSFDTSNRVYRKDGISPTLMANVSESNATKILIPQATKKGYAEMDLGGVCDLTYPNSKTRRGRVQDGGNICPTLTASNQDIVRIERTPLKFLSRNGKKVDGDYAFCVDTSHAGGIKEVYEDHYRVRKLTPLECWRLMSFSDEDFYKAKNVGISNSQLYKQAGNSIVVKVLEGIFKNLFIDEMPLKLEKEDVVREDGNCQLKWVI